MITFFHNKKAALIGVAFSVFTAWLVWSQVLSVSNQSWQWQLPQDFPEPFVPADNPMSEAKFQLGRHLFYDKRLSGNGTQACASCHFQHLAFTDGNAVSQGSTGEHTGRGAMSIVNVAYYPTLTWANPSLGLLEQQALVPMFVDNIGVELGINDQNKAEVLARFTDNADYQAMFKAAFPDAKVIDFSIIVKAIAAFERGMISADSKFDRAERGETQLTELEQNGKALFYGKAQCAQCHSGFNFSDQTFSKLTDKVEKPFHNNALYNLDGKGSYPNDNFGLIAVLPNDVHNMGKFRVPTLRNIALTAPYMHDGSIKTLEGVVDHYARQGRLITEGVHKGDGRLSPLKDPLIDKIEIFEQDKVALIAFLNTLTDESLIHNPRFSDPFSKPTGVK